jgi:hypothetical protein
MKYLSVQDSANLLFTLLGVRAASLSSWTGKVAKAKKHGFKFKNTEIQIEGRSISYLESAIERLANHLKAIPAKPNKRNAK